MSIHVTRAPTVPITSYDTKRSSHLKEKVIATDDKRQKYIKKFIINPSTVAL